MKKRDCVSLETWGVRGRARGVRGNKLKLNSGRVAEIWGLTVMLGGGL